MNLFSANLRFLTALHFSRFESARNVVAGRRVLEGVIDALSACLGIAVAKPNGEMW